MSDTPPAADLHADAKVILATDCGSTTTKAILIEEVDGVYRQTFRGEAPTTVEEPAADVTIGVRNAVREVQELSGRRLLDEDGNLVRPADGPHGTDIYISTSSAGGGLQMLVTGVVREMSAESAKRAALGAGAIVLDVLCSNDKRRPFEQIQRVRELRPDMILMAGGTDGGTVAHVAELAELIAPARPQPRFGGEYRMPVVYAGNVDARGPVADAFEGESVELSHAANVRPSLEEENLAPARDAIHDLFLQHVMAHAPGYEKLIAMADAPIMPTPGAVGLILRQIAERDGISAVGVDIGGATTDVFSVFPGEADAEGPGSNSKGGEPVFNRTVSANLGMSYSISNVVAEAGLENVLRWVPRKPANNVPSVSPVPLVSPFPLVSPVPSGQGAGGAADNANVGQPANPNSPRPHGTGLADEATDAPDERTLRNRVKNKMVRPTTIPQTLESLQFEQAVAREALRLAYDQHKAFATTLKGRQKQRTVGDLFQQSGSGSSIVDNRVLDLLVASGGVLSHAPRMEQTALMLVDAFEPKGVTELAKDSIFMMPHLGVLSSVNTRAALEVFERDCLVRLGTCVALCDPAPDGDAFDVRMDGQSFTLRGGSVKLVRLEPDATAEIEVVPTGRLDVGAGPGQTLRRTVRGGTVGLIFDARGRPLVVPESSQLSEWLTELRVYDEPPV